MAPARFEKTIGILIMLFIPAGALAREGFPVHPRRMWAITTTDQRQPLMAIGPQTCWSFNPIDQIESACTPAGRCTRIRCTKRADASTFAAGHLYFLEEPITGVGELFPVTKYRLNQELSAMRRDPVLRDMVQSLLFSRTETRHPVLHAGGQGQGGDKPPPATWYAKSASPWSLEFGAAPAVGAWVPESGEMKDAVFLFGGSLRFGFRYQTELKWHGGGWGVGSCISGLFSGLWELARGNQYGADLRLHWLREGDRNRFLLGIQPLSRYVPRLEQDHHFLRFPSLLSILVPEAGLVLGNRTSPGWYVRWMLMPVSLLLTGNMGLELRLAQGLVGDDGTAVKAFWSASLGILVRG